MTDASQTTLRGRLQAEAGLLDLTRDDQSDFVLHLQRVAGNYVVDVLTWTGDRRQHIGRGTTFADAWHAAYQVEGSTA